MRAVKDMQKIEKITKPYCKGNVAAMAFLMDANEKRAYTVSGNAKALAAGVLEILVNLSLTMTEPGKRRLFVEQLVEAVGEMCKEVEEREHGI